METQTEREAQFWHAHHTIMADASTRKDEEGVSMTPSRTSAARFQPYPFPRLERSKLELIA